MATARLTRPQLKIMDVLWRKGRVTAREITDTLNEHDSTAHSTVQTLLRRLEKKGVVKHEREDRTFYFFATVEKDKVKSNSIRDLIDHLFGGEPAGLVSYLLKNEDIQNGELDDIRKLLDKGKREKDSIVTPRPKVL